MGAGVSKPEVKGTVEMMRRITGFAFVIAFVVAGGAPGSAAAAQQPGSSLAGSEIAAAVREGIPPDRARKLLLVESEVAETNIMSNVEAVLGSNYAGAWFEPATGQLDIGVTSAASRRAVEGAVTQAGLTKDVTETSVRSTWAQLLAAKHEWDRRLRTLLTSYEAETGIGRAALSITLSSSVPSEERVRIEREAASGDVNASVSVLAGQLSVTPLAGDLTSCYYKKEGAKKTNKAYCEKQITSGVLLENENTGQECTAGPMLIKGVTTYVLTSGHCGAEGATFKSRYANLLSNTPLGKAKNVVYGGEASASDFEEIEVEPPGAGKFWTGPLPDPITADMAQWTKEGVEMDSVRVDGEGKSILGETNCHEGEASGHQCGMVTKVVVNAGNEEELVEDTALGEAGDSGGPWYFTPMGTTEVYMQGVTKAKKVQSNTTLYVPLEFILHNPMYEGQELLTKKNEKRPTSAIILSVLHAILKAGSEYISVISNLVIGTDEGDVECPEDQETGTLNTVQGKKDTDSVSQETSSGGEEEGDCSTTTGLGRAALEWGGFPWSTDFTTSGEAVVKGTKEVLLTATFPEADGAKCEFSSKKVTGSFAPGPAGTPTPLEITTSGQVFKLNKKFKKNSAGCPMEATLSDTQTLTSGGETVEDEVT